MFSPVVLQITQWCRKHCYTGTKPTQTPPRKFTAQTLCSMESADVWSELWGNFEWVLTLCDPERESLEWTQLLLRFSLRKLRESMCRKTGRKYCMCVSQGVSYFMSLKTRVKKDNLNLLLSYCHPEISLDCLESLCTFCNYFSYPEHFIWINGKIWLKCWACVTLALTPDPAES